MYLKLFEIIVEAKDKLVDKLVFVLFSLKMNVALKNSTWDLSA